MILFSASTLIRCSLPRSTECKSARNCDGCPSVITRSSILPSRMPEMRPNEKVLVICSRSMLLRRASSRSAAKDENGFSISSFPKRTWPPNSSAWISPLVLSVLPTDCTSGIDPVNVPLKGGQPRASVSSSSCTCFISAENDNCLGSLMISGQRRALISTAPPKISARIGWGKIKALFDKPSAVVIRPIDWAPKRACSIARTPMRGLAFDACGLPGQEIWNGRLSVIGPICQPSGCARSSPALSDRSPSAVRVGRLP